jgi:hypothetical protein
VLDDFDNHTPVPTTTDFGTVIGNRLTLAHTADTQSFPRHLTLASKVFGNGLGTAFREFLVVNVRAGGIGMANDIHVCHILAQQGTESLDLFVNNVELPFIRCRQISTVKLNLRKVIKYFKRFLFCVT